MISLLQMKVHLKNDKFVKDDMFIKKMISLLEMISSLKKIISLLEMISSLKNDKFVRDDKFIKRMTSSLKNDSIKSNNTKLKTIKFVSFFSILVCFFLSALSFLNTQKSQN